MEIFPQSTIQELLAQLTQTVSDNIIVIIGVVGLATAIYFVVNWFTKSLPFYGGSIGSTISNYRHRND